MAKLTVRISDELSDDLEAYATEHYDGVKSDAVRGILEDTLYSSDGEASLRVVYENDAGWQRDIRLQGEAATEDLFDYVYEQLDG